MLPARRLLSLDLLRGLVIVLMAIDHVRDFYSPFPYQPEDLGQASAGLFLTRWITHFCAPVFVFLAGTSAWLYGHQRALATAPGSAPDAIDKAGLSRFLLSRGLWLILLELLIVNPSWSHGFNWSFVQVIWALGWSMILLAGLLWLPARALLIVSLALVAGHNLLDRWTPADFGAAAPWWGLLHAQYWIPVQPQGYGIFVAYPLLPWPAVMALGYLLGRVYTDPAIDARALLWKLGAGCIAAFLLLRLLLPYGDPQPLAGQPDHWLALLNTTKYPPSLQFLLMTLGPALCLLAWWRRYDGQLDRIAVAPGWLAQRLLVFGAVPLFFYLLHTPVISLSALAWHHWAAGTAFNPMNTPPPQWPEGYQPSLPRIYIAWTLLLLLLYPLCVAYGRFKRRARSPLWKLL
ncbi:MAG: heparan-alpha-glucosaminide N-acetyltransferase domain-containing protein [Lysobacterales bacterium]